MRINLHPQNLTTIAGKYLRTISREISDADFPLHYLDIKRLEGIQKDIPLFDGVRMEEIKFLTRNFSVLNIARGCFARCSHCLRNAKLPQTDKATTILWEDLLRFTDGFDKLNNRMGFNILQGNDYLVLHDDFNPPVFSVKDISGNIHNYADAVRLVFEKLHIPIEVVTSGWTKGNVTADKAAVELVDYFAATPEANALTSISINPFHHLLEKSREFSRLQKPEQARYFREAYIDSIANALKTFLPLFREGKASILYKYSPSHSETGAKETSKIYREIYEKLQLLVGDSLKSIEDLHPKNFESDIPEFHIEPKGRGRRFFSSEENLRKQKNLIAEKVEYNSQTPEQRIEDAYKYTIKEVDINGKIYCRTISENMFDSGISLNYKNKEATTPEVFSDIKLSPISREDIIETL